MEKTVINDFRGLNQNYFAAENEFYSEQNITADHYPIFSTREKRHIYSNDFTALTAMNASQGKLCYVNGTKFYYNGVEYGTVTVGDKQIVTMGAYLIIYPDKKIFNTTSLTMDSMDATFVTTGNINYYLTQADGTEYDTPTISATPPQEAQDGDLWIDTSASPHTLKQYSASAASWISIPTTYTKITSNGIGSFFEEYDGISITGSTIPQLNADFTVVKRDVNYIVVQMLIDEVTTQATAITIKRETPDMDFICECNNRIWGCSSANHEIYASRLGDPKNFRSYAGISTDSYAATIGSDGDFTGCISHLGYVLFFKEDIIHKVYGNKPANYQISDLHARGVKKGSSNSLCVVNETLYYLSRDGIMQYDGALPQEISQSLGHKSYKNASAGSVGNKYYVSMQDESDVYSMFVFDESKGLWHKEDEIEAKSFTRIGGGLFFINDNLIYCIGEAPELPFADVDEEENFKWYAETGQILYRYIDKGYLARINVRCFLPYGSTMKISIKYDHNDYEMVKYLYGGVNTIQLAAIVPHRAETIRLKFSGKGKCRIEALSKELELGSDG